MNVNSFDFGIVYSYVYTIYVCVCLFGASQDYQRDESHLSMYTKCAVIVNVYSFPHGIVLNANSHDKRKDILTRSINRSK